MIFGLIQAVLRFKHPSKLEMGFGIAGTQRKRFAIRNPGQLPVTLGLSLRPALSSGLPFLLDPRLERAVSRCKRCLVAKVHGNSGQ